MSETLVMGGSAFVGSSMAQYLINNGHTVDILTRGNKKVNYKGYRNHIICNRKSENEIVKVLEGKQYEYIFDISAYTKEDVKILISNLNKNKLKKYIFISSGAVYKPSNKLISEDFERAENVNWGQYGLDKKEAEDYIMGANIPYAIFRPSYIYGEENNLYREGFFFDRLKEKKIIPMPYGNKTITQFIHIEDLIKAMASAMSNSIEKGAYNLSNSEEVSWETLIKACSLAVGEVPKIKRINRELYESRSYFPFRDVTYTLNIEKLKKDGLYVPKISLVEGMRRTYKWYVDNNIKISDSRMSMIEELSKNI